MFTFNSHIEKEKARQYSPIVLAFVGDAVYSLYIREKITLTAEHRPNEMQKMTSKEVSAHGQSELLERVMPKFNEEEMDVFKRGRNAKKATKSKNASVGEYNRSTGFEAVLGYLYLSGQYDRIDAILGEEE